ncbi:hypothetical protein QCA50_008971 [Cerrena zonata]|uniref:DUF6535 domain-containing protein n=1 Tax=Cerrena zonata TaxID=2478898 RepID=A0AAW0G885_9APHY
MSRQITSNSTIQASQPQRTSTTVQKTSQSKDAANSLAKVDSNAIDDCLERLRNYRLWTGGLCGYVTLFLVMSHRIILEVPVRAYTRPSSIYQFHFEEGSTDYFPPPRTATQLVSNTIRVRFFWLSSFICCGITLIAGYSIKRRLLRYKTAQVTLPRTSPRPEHMRHLRIMRWRVLETAALMPLLFLTSMFLFLIGISEYLYSLNPFAGSFVLIFIALAMTGSLWLTVGLAHQIQFLFTRDLDLPADPAFPSDDPQRRKEAIALYSDLEINMREKLSKVEGEEVVERVRGVMSQLLCRDIHHLKADNKDLWRELWRMTLRGRAAISQLMIDALNRQVTDWRDSADKEEVVWDPWMDEALTCIDAILASAPDTFALSLEAVSAGKLLVSLLGQNDVVAGKVLACLASRKSTLIGQEIPSIESTQALRNLIAGARQLACTGRVDPLALRQVVLVISNHIQDSLRKKQDEELTGMLSQFNIR